MSVQFAGTLSAAAWMLVTVIVRLLTFPQIGSCSAIEAFEVPNPTNQSEQGTVVRNGWDQSATPLRNPSNPPGFWLPQSGYGDEDSTFGKRLILTRSSASSVTLAQRDNGRDFTASAGEDPGAARRLVLNGGNPGAVESETLPSGAQVLGSDALVHTLLDREDASESRGRYAEAAEACRQALTAAERSDKSPLIFEGLRRLARLLEVLGKYREAEQLYGRAVSVAEKEADHRYLADALTVLARYYCHRGANDRADQLCQRALVLRAGETGNDFGLANTLATQAEIQTARNQYVQADTTYRRVLAIRVRAGYAQSAAQANTLGDLGYVCFILGRYPEAETLYQRSLTLFTATRGPDHPETARTLRRLAELETAEKRYGEAERLLNKAIPIWKAALGPDHPDVGVALVDLGMVYYQESKLNDADSYLRQAEGIFERSLNPDDSRTLSLLNDLATIQQAKHLYREAAELYSRALAIGERTPGSQGLVVAITLSNLAGAYCGDGRYAEAEPLYLRALKIVGEGTDRTPDYAVILDNYAALLKKMNRKKEARKIDAQLRSMKTAFASPDHNASQVDWHELQKP
jgi:tetratricopeptide (TPR) repeat protein